MEGSPSPEQLAEIRARQLDAPVPEDAGHAEPELNKRVSSATLLGVIPPISARELLERAATQVDQPASARLGTTQFGRRSPLQIRREASNDTRPATLDPAKTVPLALSRTEVLGEGRRILEGRRGTGAGRERARRRRLPERFTFMLSVLAGCVMGVVVAVTGLLLFRSQSSPRGSGARGSDATPGHALREEPPRREQAREEQAREGQAREEQAREGQAREGQPREERPREEPLPAAVSPAAPPSVMPMPARTEPAPLPSALAPSETTEPASASSEDSEKSRATTESAAKSEDDAPTPRQPRHLAPLPSAIGASLPETEPPKPPPHAVRSIAGTPAPRPPAKKVPDGPAQPGPDAVLPLSLD